MSTPRSQGAHQVRHEVSDERQVARIHPNAVSAKHRGHLWGKRNAGTLGSAPQTARRNLS